MDRDQDIRPALPDPPPPAPARRSAAIGAAMRRFDGLAEPRTERSPGAGARRPWYGRPQFGLAASLALVVLIGGPVAWQSFRDPLVERQTAPPPVLNSRAAPQAAAEESIASMDVAGAAAPAAADAASAAEKCAGRDCVDAERSVLADAAPPAPPPGMQPGAPPPSPAIVPPASLAQADAFASSAQQMRSPAPARAESKAQESEPAEAQGSIVVTGSRVSPRLGQRGDWNECTLDDPRRALARCRTEIAGAAKSGRAAESVGEGLNRGWSGDLDEAIAAFDRAIAEAPRSSLAYINRGLAYQKRGELDRAIADFDKAVRFAPASARAYYMRSQALRQRGDGKRAERDLRRAIDLDPSYRETLD